jgi:hypothetical protein
MVCPICAAAISAHPGWPRAATTMSSRYCSRGRGQRFLSRRGRCALRRVPAIAVRAMQWLWVIIIGFLVGLVAKWFVPGPYGFIVTTLLAVPPRDRDRTPALPRNGMAPRPPHKFRLGRPDGPSFRRAEPARDQNGPRASRGRKSRFHVPRKRMSGESGNGVRPARQNGAARRQSPYGRSERRAARWRRAVAGRSARHRRIDAGANPIGHIATVEQGYTKV